MRVSTVIACLFVSRNGLTSHHQLTLHATWTSRIQVAWTTLAVLLHTSYFICLEQGANWWWKVHQFYELSETKLTASILEKKKKKVWNTQKAKKERKKKKKLFVIGQCTTTCTFSVQMCSTWQQMNGYGTLAVKTLNRWLPDCHDRQIPMEQAFFTF